MGGKLNRIILVKEVENCQFFFVFWLPSKETRD